MYYTKSTRHGSIIIGDSMSGKSSILKVLLETQNLMQNYTKFHEINPKIYSI